MREQRNRQWELVSSETEQKYLEACRSFASSDAEFNRFRSNSSFGVILEGGSQQTLQGNLESLAQLGAEDWFVDNFDEFVLNDSVGGPTLYEVSPYGILSPSIAQYALQLYEISQALKEGPVSAVVEVGGGYGGLARMFAAHLKPEKYVLIDHPEVLQVARRYLSHFELKTQFEFVSCFDLGPLKSATGIDVFISAAALAELSLEQQIAYNNSLICKSNFFYLTYNTLHLREGRKNLVTLSSTWTEFRTFARVTWERSLVIVGVRGSAAKRRSLSWMTKVDNLLPQIVQLTLFRANLSRRAAFNPQRGMR